MGRVITLHGEQGEVLGYSVNSYYSSNLVRNFFKMNLKKSENTMIGNPAKNIKGISGGEKRSYIFKAFKFLLMYWIAIILKHARLSFACELITDPNLLFVDEPTSGLDSYMAIILVNTVRDLADQGKTIICKLLKYVI